MRPPHYLRPVKTTQAPTQIASVDARVMPGGIVAWHAVFERREGKKWTRGSSQSGSMPEEFWAWLWSRGKIDRCTWLWSTNWVRILLPIGLDWQTDSGDSEVGLAAIARSCWWVTLKKEERSCELIDLRNWFQGLRPQIEVAESPSVDAHTAAKLTAERLQLLIKGLISRAVELDMGCIQPTLGSWSMNLWRHWHKGKMVCCGANDPADKFAREAYYGGECRIRRLGEYDGEWKEVDVNHLYGSVMGQNLLPYHCLGLVPASTVRELEELPEDQGAIARVEIDSPVHTYPFRQKDRTLFARGRFWTVLPEPELRSALWFGHVRNVERAAFFRLADLCGPWSRRLWELRQSIDEGPKSHLGTLLKLLTVALHGRFGQHGAEWQTGKGIALVPWGLWISPGESKRMVMHRGIGNKCETKVRSENEPTNSFPAIAAWTTSLGRMAMHALREKAGEDNCYYQFTDSLWVNKEGFSRLDAEKEIREKGLGKCKVKSEGRKLNVMGPGWVAIDGKVKASGVGEAVIKDSPDHYELIHEVGPVGVFGPSGPRAYHNAIVEVHFPPPETWGVFKPDGWVEPPLLPLGVEHRRTSRSPGTNGKAGSGTHHPSTEEMVLGPEPAADDTGDAPF